MQKVPTNENRSAMTQERDSRLVVLVVEDDPLIRMEAIDMIEDAGFRARGAKSADAAIAILERHDDIAILFTDIDMPGSMDGLKLAAYVRDRWPPVAIFIASGIVETEGLTFPKGSSFFPKPYPTSAIVNALHHVAGQLT